MCEQVQPGLCGVWMVLQYLRGSGRPRAECGDNRAPGSVLFMSCLANVPVEGMAKAVQSHASEGEVFLRVEEYSISTHMCLVN